MTCKHNREDTNTQLDEKLLAEQGFSLVGLKHVYSLPGVLQIG